MSIKRFPVEAGHILLFARAIGDTDPAWAGAERDGRPVPAPPTFVQAGAQFDPDYHLRPQPGLPWKGSGREATGVRPKDRAADGAGAAGSEKGESEDSGTGLHAEQHYTYHRPLRSGTVLNATVEPGATWSKDGRRGGRLLFSETITEYRDEAGDLIVTARAVGVRTGKVVAAGPDA